MRDFDPIGQHAGLYGNNYSKQETQAFSAAFNQITEGFREAFSEGLNAEDSQVQALVRQHFEFCSQFWTPTREAYKSLATSYLLPTPYRDTYEAIQPGLAKYHYDAMVLWAERNLK